MRTARLGSSVASLLFAGSLIAGTAQAQQGQQGRGRGDDHEQHVSPQEQQQRIDEQRKRQTQYQQTLAKQVKTEQQHVADLQKQKRGSEAAIHQQYIANLQQQQARASQQHDYAHDPYFTTPASFRYHVGSSYHQTNQYGADQLRQAVNLGYQQGYEAGRADRRDGWKSNYQKSYAYQDANYGYDGSYIPQGDYNIYFREGFRRGYEDGYGSRLQYGSLVNGTPTILAGLMTTILGLSLLH